MEVIKKYWYLLAIGLIIRVIFSAFSYHPDIKSQVIATRSYLEGNLDPYSQASNISPGAVLDKLPMSYFLQFPFHLVGRLLITTETENSFFKEPKNLFGQYQLWMYLVYAKLPLIFFDLALGVLLALVVAQYQKKVLMFWIFNPLTLWATEAIGQIDIYSTFFILLSFYLLKKGKLELSALSLGFGGAVKTAPFLLLPLLLIFAKDLKTKVLILFLAIVPYLFSVVWYIRSPHFRNDAFLAPQINKSLFAQIPLSGGEAIMIFVALLSFIYLIYFQKGKDVQDYIKYSTVILLMTLSVTHFHIQWALWVMPFLVIWVLDNFRQSTYALIGLSVSLIMMLFLFESSLQLKLFAPLFPQLNDAKGLVEILKTDQVFFLRSLTASVFAGCSAFLSFKILQK